MQRGHEPLCAKQLTIPLASNEEEQADQFQYLLAVSALPLIEALPTVVITLTSLSGSFLSTTSSF